ncbi:sensor histidine kinase [Sanguibacter antarcticus]|uniref:histidine kinase n=1 Tax=Sanguibacter antarcticus TaxID=372484 RepID=A0A2A9EAS8_9MICO|nr:HAMP domain-containing sensor histidine kinase [Sanguibacter antarcticus]PFG32203.1 two-component system OmpR family sensor kinase [Sanguibacter antarcticus]PFG35320.1 two-component system OmpR family sensor kinase [Sanguibacter antarcticus]
MSTEIRPAGMGPVPPPPPESRDRTQDLDEAELEDTERAGLSDEGRHVGPILSAWARTPLRVRLVGIVTLVLLASLAIAAAVTNTLVSRTLEAQIDSQLESTAEQLANQALASLSTEQEQTLPSDYYIVLFPYSGRSRGWYQAENVELHGVPKVGPYTFANSDIPPGPFTTAAVNISGSDIPSDAQWRVIALTASSGGEDQGIVFVGLPLDSVRDTVGQIQKLLAISALVITTLGAAVGYLAVRQSFRPLGEIERTAAAIAEGDLSRRVPQAPSSTEVGSLARSLNSMLSQIEQAFDAREASEARMRRFIADASHELRTPLATVRGYGELYRMGALTTPEALSDTMRRIEDSATRMGSLVEDLLRLARLDEGRPLDNVPVDLAVVASDAMSDLHALDPSRQVRLVPLQPDGQTGACVVVGDEGRLRQVLANLVGNAARHTPRGTPVEVALGFDTDDDGERTAVLEVRDHGPGIPSEHGERVFERFFRVDSSRNRDSGGSGLGLAIVAAIVERLGGAARVQETPGGGLTVRIELPAAAEA